jgi:urea ABC transporter ATP-binding protein UrtD
MTASDHADTSAPLLEVRGLKKHFGGIRALDGVDLSLSRSELKCLLGPNGCGKTTLFNVVTGATPPTAGEVRLRGESIAGQPAHLIARKGVGRKFQVPGVFSELSVSENLEIALRAPDRSVGRLAVTRPAPLKERAAELLDFCGLRTRRLAMAGSLAHGEKQWLEIAMLLAADAELLLLDEPTAGMSVVETERTADLVRGLSIEFGKTVLVIEHDMNFVRLLQCTVAAMMRGVVIAEGSYDTIRSDVRVLESYLGHAA